MNINNIDKKFGFIKSNEAGEFLSWIGDNDFMGIINGSSKNVISIQEILDYTYKITGKKAVISSDGENAPYNDTPDYIINTDKAVQLGFEFTDLRNWIYNLLDKYILL